MVQNLKNSLKDDEVLSDNKNQIEEIKHLEKKNAELNFSLENYKSELKDTRHKLGKKVKQLESEIKELTDFRVTKIAETEETINQLEVEVETKDSTIKTLEEKLDAAEVELYSAFEKVKEEKKKVSEDMKFLRDSAQESSGEAFNMEWKLSVVNEKSIKKEKENAALNKKVKILEESNNRLIYDIKSLEDSKFKIKSDPENEKRAQQNNSSVYDQKIASPKNSKAKPNLPDPELFPPFSIASKASKDLNSKILFPPIGLDLQRTVIPANSHDSVPVVVEDSRTITKENASDLDTGGGKSRTFP